MSEIITHTPIWVFLLFLFLLFLGLSQTKDRNVSFKRVIVLPIIMLLFSFIGVISTFGINLVSLSTYLICLFLSIYLGILLKLPRNATFIKEEKVFHIKGSFIPFFLIMAIFFTKYFVGVVTARELAFISSGYFILIVSSLYGFFSGIFFGRIFVLKKKMI
ncbi:MAG: hypothetical protein C0625_04145 [Arcobacter sp.]|nr:MAG: hypothetical protein C0625_04145 [Arcobacter sp.]